MSPVKRYSTLRKHLLYQFYVTYVGTGVATVVITFWLVTYYIVILAWALYYLFNSLRQDVPWKGCQNPWNKSN